MKIVADAHIPYIKQYVNPQDELLLIHGRAISRADLVDADILLVRSITRVDEKLLDQTAVKFVGSVTAGADHLDTAWLDQKGIAWQVAVGFNAPPVADYVVSVVAALLQRDYLPKDKKRAAVIGVGNVGKLVSAHLSLLGFDVINCDPLRENQEPNFASTPLDAIADVDLISLHVPLTRAAPYATYHFIDQAFLERQKPGTVLLNASRGAVIDSNALLMHGKHLTLCLDVWEHEPSINKALLEQATIATPHIAGYSVQSKMRGIDMIYRLLEEQRWLTPASNSKHELPHQTLLFADVTLTWQSILLGIFNPWILTAMMKSILLPADDYGHLFDEMRNHFNYRHEFAYSTLNGVKLKAPDAKILQALRVQIT